MATKLPLERVAVADVMICALAARIGGSDLVGVGLGTPLALAATLLARATHAPGCHVLAGGTFDAKIGLGGFLDGYAGRVGNTVGYVSHFDSMDMAERQAMTLQFLRPAQVDGDGNLNTSRIGSRERPQLRLPGGLATADVPSLLPRLVVYLPDHRLRNLPRRVAFVTGSGGGWSGPLYPTAGVVAVVTDLAVIEIATSHSLPGTTARLVSVHPWTSVEEVVEVTGFDMEARPAMETAGPDREQTAALRRIDPDQRRVAEIRKPG